MHAHDVCILFEVSSVQTWSMRCRKWLERSTFMTSTHRASPTYLPTWAGQGILLLLWWCSIELHAVFSSVITILVKIKMFVIPHIIIQLLVIDVDVHSVQLCTGTHWNRWFCLAPPNHRSTMVQMNVLTITWKANILIIQRYVIYMCHPMHILYVNHYTKIAL